MVATLNAELVAEAKRLHATGKWEAFVRATPSHLLVPLERALAVEAGHGWRADPLSMAQHLGAQPALHRWPYTDLLSRKFTEAVHGTSPRQIWNLPSRYGKSTVASRWGPVWCFDAHPEAKIILTSYGDVLANEHAAFVRDMLANHADVLGCTLRRDRRRSDLFVTSAGGGLLAAGIGSGIAGFGAGSGGGLIVDDPYKNWQEAHSPARRKMVWDAYRSVLRMRLDSEDAWIIVVHTRWHEEDLSGMLLAEMLNGDGETWDLVRLPAIAEQHDPLSSDFLTRQPDLLGRAPGEPLEPRRFPLDAVKRRAATLGSYLSAAIEQQRPAPEEGGEVKRAWWRWDTTMPLAADAWCTSWDMKLKDKEAGDFVVGQAWARTGGDFWCVDQLRGQWNQSTTKAAIALMQVRHPHISTHYVENTGNGPEVMAELRMGSRDYVLSDDVAAVLSQLGATDEERDAVVRIMRRGLSGLVPVNVKGSKSVRLRAVSGIIEAGNVHLPERADWAGALVEEAAAFPNGAHDDMVDALSQALAKMRRDGQGTVAVPTTAVVSIPAASTPLGVLAPTAAGVPQRRGNGTRRLNLPPLS